MYIVQHSKLRCPTPCDKQRELLVALSILNVKKKQEFLFSLFAVLMSVDTKYYIQVERTCCH